MLAFGSVGGGIVVVVVVAAEVVGKWIVKGRQGVAVFELRQEDELQTTLLKLKRRELSGGHCRAMSKTRCCPGVVGD